jgi:hypothetical protein|nr:MAG TPA: hypothetical protein [Herelleviridae sp.]
MDLEKLEIAIRKNLVLNFEDGKSVGISFLDDKRVKLLNRTEDLSVVVEFDDLKALKERNYLYCEVKNDVYFDLNTVNIMYKCVREAIKNLIKL